MLACWPCLSLGQVTLYTCDFGTTSSASLTAMGKWSSASPNVTSTGCTGQGWKGYVGSSDYCTTTAISIPSGATATLSFNYSYNYSIGLPTVSIGTTPSPTSVVKTLASAASCTHQTIDLTAYAGQTIYIRFDENSSSTTYNLVLDDVLVTYTIPPPPSCLLGYQYYRFRIQRYTQCESC